MNKRLKNILLCVAFGIATYLSSKLWNVFAYPNPMNLVCIIFSALLLVATITYLVKSFSPKAKFMDLVSFFLGSF